MDKIRIYIALLFCQAISLILPVQAQDNTGNNSNRYNTLYSYDCMGNITSLSRNGLLDDGSYDYYPYGGLMLNSTGWNTQRYKYNGKELDRMHGLDWYDYGARWMDAAIGRWHVMDPLCEKYYDVSPYAYCHNNPIMLFDLDGMDDYYDYYGDFLFSDNEETDNIIIRSWVDFSDISIPIDKKIDEIELPAESYSNIFTNTLALLPSSDGVNVESLYNGKISVVVWNIEDANVKMSDNYYNNPSMVGDAIATTSVVNDNALITAYVSKDETMFFTTRSNIQNILGIHEYIGHYVNGWNNRNNLHTKVYEMQMNHPTWSNATNEFKKYTISVLKDKQL